MLARGVEATGMEEDLKAVLSLAPQERYNSHLDAYHLACTLWRTRPEHIVFVSSNGWDVAGASQFGFQTIWTNRADVPQEGWELNRWLGCRAWLNCRRLSFRRNS